MNDFHLNYAVVSSLGWTILHSLWQATVLAGLLWAGSRLVTASAVRYRLAYGTLLAQLLVSGLTFAWLYEPVSGGETAIVVLTGFTPFAAAASAAPWWQPAALLPWVVAFWLVGLVIGTARLAFSLGRVRGMQREAGGAVPDHFRRLVTRLAARIGYHGPLHLGISERVGGPALVGHLKPMLLFPVAVVNQLTPDQAEAVILHELAHLRRRDHWWNLLQCVVEVVFYYHPVVWWIGARIREEREHCCDDLVLRHGPDRLAYAKALLYFEQQSATPATAVALTNSPTGLLARVKRFLHQQNLPYQMKSRLFLLPLLALIALVSTAVYAPVAEDDDHAGASPATLTDLAPPTATAPAAAPKKPAPNTAAMQPDTLPKGRHQVSTYRNGSSTKVTVEDRAIKRLEIDGRVIPESEYEQYLPTVERMLGTRDQETDGHDRPLLDDHDFDALELRFEAMGDDLENTFEGLGEKWEYRFEGMGDDWEAFGESMGELGERIGLRIERLFDGDGNHQNFRMDFDRKGEGTYYFNTDSLPPGGIYKLGEDGDGQNIIIRRGQREGLDELLEEVERERGNAAATEADIREMETMIERLERRKARMKSDLERQQADSERFKSEEQRSGAEVARARQDAERAERDAVKATEEARRAAREAKGTATDYEAIVSQLQKEGLVNDDGPLRKLSVDGEAMKINGKKADAAAHRRFMELYEAQTGKAFGRNSKVTISTSSN